LAFAFCIAETVMGIVSGGTTEYAKNKGNDLVVADSRLFAGANVLVLAAID
jgi:hypothetical protein